MNKIVVLDGYTLNPNDLSWDGLEELGDVQIYDRTPKDQILERAKDAQIIFTNKTPLSGQTLAQLPTLKYIGVLATGYNVVDIAAAKKLNIVVTNIPAYGTTAVAQHTFALLLEACHRVGAHSDSVKSGEWSKSADFCYWKYPLIELCGKTLGLVGYGRIGRAVAEIAQAFGMKVLVHSRSYEGAVSLDELFSKSDVVSFHCPLTEENKEMLNKTTIAKMKDGVVVVNTARGQLVNEADLAQALNEGKVAVAAVDVLSTEPPAPTNPLLSAKNCILTPHIAWAPKESRMRLMNIAVSNLRAFLEGKATNIVG